MLAWPLWETPIPPGTVPLELPNYGDGLVRDGSFWLKIFWGLIFFEKNKKQK